MVLGLPGTRTRAKRLIAEEAQRRTRRARIGSWVAGGALGALLAYLLDPQQGKRRRKVGRDRIAGTMRRGFRRTARTARRAGAEAYGAAQKVIHLKEEPKVFDDVTLARKVESEIFRDAEVKAAVNVNVEDGVVVLRGELKRPEKIRELEREVAGIPGVRGVRSLLHLEGTEAPGRTPTMGMSKPTG